MVFTVTAPVGFASSSISKHAGGGSNFGKAVGKKILASTSNFTIAMENHRST